LRRHTIYQKPQEKLQRAMELEESRGGGTPNVSTPNVSTPAHAVEGDLQASEYWQGNATFK